MSSPEFPGATILLCPVHMRFAGKADPSTPSQRPGHPRAESEQAVQEPAGLSR
jgi:hypothetical protein